MTSTQVIKLGLAVLMLLPVLVTCADNGPKQPEIGPISSPPPDTEGNPAFAPYEPAIEIGMVRETTDSLEDMIAGLPGESLLDNRWTRLYEEELGIRIRYDWVDKGVLYHQKMGVSLASGAIPDVVRVNAQQLRRLSNANQLQDLTYVYEAYASPLTREILNEEGPSPLEMGTIDGRLMGIPETSGSVEQAMFIWLRTDWLEALDLQPPTTMQELLAISEAFTEMDPDGSGANDTYGLGIASHIWDPVAGLVGFMAGYDAYPNIWIDDGDGRLVYGGIQPQVKEALAVLRQMYLDGQIDSEFGLKNGLKVQRDIAEGRIGLIYGEQWSSFFVQPSRAGESEAQWQAFPIVSATDALPRVPLKVSPSQFWAVRKGYEHPEALLKLFNLHLEKNWGETADYEKYYSTPQPVWQLSPVTPYPGRKNLDAYRQLEEARRTDDYTRLQAEARAIHKNITIYQAGGEDRETGWGWERTYGPEGAFSIVEQYEQNDQFLMDGFAGAPTEAMIDRQFILSNLQHETYINIIMGRPLSDFDAFVEDWHALGGEAITTEVNRWLRDRNRS